MAIANGNSFGFTQPDQPKKPAGLGVLFQALAGGAASLMLEYR